MNKNIILIAFIITVISSCSKQLDEVFPRDRIAAEELNENDIGKLRNGLYAQMEDGVFSFAFDFDVRGENFRGGPGICPC
jgi:starch-binding outer membrane protein, SusD/RagB family